MMDAGMTSDKNVTWDLYPMIMLKRFLTDRSGATAIEYGLIATLISIAILGGATVWAISSMWFLTRW